MFFSSIPAYLDPANWQQQPNHQAGASNTQAISSRLLPPPPPPQPPPPPPPPPQPHGSGGAGSIRPGSMADRARLANIPMPEAALNCPRCESTNTKFCYFNNYSLTQPRHFCKTCRRYWTRGGALRNVPVGGGCRRNKRSKGSSSNKSPASGDRQTVSGGSSSTVSSNSDILGSLGPQVPPLRFMAPLHHHNELTTPTDHQYIGLSYGTVLSNPVGGASEHLNFQIGSELASAGLGTSVVSGGVGGGSLLPLGGLDHWRFQQRQQFPFLSGLDSSNSSNSSAGICAFEGGVEPSSYVGGLIRPKISNFGATQSASVKMEELQEINLSRQFSGINHGNDPYWSTGSGWTDLSSFRSSSTGNPL